MPRGVCKPAGTDGAVARTSALRLKAASPLVVSYSRAVASDRLFHPARGSSLYILPRVEEHQGLNTFGMRQMKSERHVTRQVISLLSLPARPMNISTQPCRNGPFF